MSLLTTLYINGNVYTVNDKQPQAQAFVVDSNGNFAAVGSNDEILSAYGHHAHRIVDLKGRFVMPGIHDAHTHLLAAAMQQLYEVSIGNDSTEKTLGPTLQEHCQCLQAHSIDDWLIANFYDAQKFPGGKVDRKYLDEYFPDRPVVVRDVSCHNVVANTEALKRTNYDLRNEKAPFAGELVLREDGTLTGELIEQANVKLWLNMPPTPLSAAQKAISHALRINNQWGITSCQEASANTIYLAATSALERANTLTCNIFTHIVYGPVGIARETSESLHHLISSAADHRTRHVSTNFVKFWLDGAPLAPHFTQCDLDEETHQIDHSKLVLQPDDFLQGLRSADARGFTCKIHVAGNGSARLALDAIESIRATNPSGPRHELAHCNKIHPSDQARFAPLRVTAEMSPAIFHLDDLISASQGQLVWPFKSLLDHKAHLTIGSDWILPETPNIFPALPPVISQIGVDAVIRAITLSGAEAVGRAHDFGSIETGKKASFIVLDEDLTRRKDVAQTLVLKTWFEGKLVWDSENAGVKKEQKIVCSPQVVEMRATVMA